MSDSRRVNPALIRQLNTARIFHAVRLHPGASQRRLGEVTGLDKATISAVVRALEEDGLITRTPRSSGRVGRPEVALEVAREGVALVGARLEPSSIRLMAATLAGEALHTLQIPGSTRVDDALDLLEQGFARLLREAGLGTGQVRSLGVGVPGLFDEDGRLAFAPNLGWHDVPIRSRLRNALDVPVHVDNDTKAAGLAEKLFGSCRDVQDFLFVAGHSGIGGALYLDGRLYRGAHGYAGELGHVKVRRGGRSCACGGRGCLEAYLSEASLLRQAAEEGLPARDLAELDGAVRAGDRAARTIVTRAAGVLGDACADLVNLFNPERIVLGGNLATVAEPMLSIVEERLSRGALEAPRGRCKVGLSTFGVEAVTMGGVALALEGFLSLPYWMVASELGGAL